MRVLVKWYSYLWCYLITKTLRSTWPTFSHGFILYRIVSKKLWSLWDLNPRPNAPWLWRVTTAGSLRRDTDLFEVGKRVIWSRRKHDRVNKSRHVQNASLYTILIIPRIFRDMTSFSNFMNICLWYKCFVRIIQFYKIKICMLCSPFMMCDTDERTHNIIVLLIADKCHVLYYLNI